MWSSRCLVLRIRPKRGLFHRANWNANMYRAAMLDIVFLTFDVVKYSDVREETEFDDNNSVCDVFVAFLSVYLILRQLTFLSADIDNLHAGLKHLHTSAVYRTLGPWDILFPGFMKRKFHSMFKHWVDSILRFGAPFHYSGEANEEFHKVACKVRGSVHRRH